MFGLKLTNFFSFSSKFSIKISAIIMRAQFVRVVDAKGINIVAHGKW